MKMKNKNIKFEILIIDWQGQGGHTRWGVYLFNNQNWCKVLGQLQLSWKKGFVFKNKLKPHILVSHVDSADSSKVSCDERGKDFADEPSL